jgi:X-Pro dipeptidyl-peptidase C-terminal non-catalytic domain
VLLALVHHLCDLSCSWPEVVLWVASSDADADVFVYLEDYDPVADVARYVTEGHFRASHRREHAAPPPGDPRAASHIPGEHMIKVPLRRRMLLGKCLMGVASHLSYQGAYLHRELESRLCCHQAAVTSFVHDQLQHARLLVTFIVTTEHHSLLTC